MSNVLAVVEQRGGEIKQGAAEVLTAARGVADASGGTVDALVVGPPDLDVSMLETHGADTVISAADVALGLYQPDGYTAAVVQQAQSADYRAIIVGATAMGKDLAPRVAARLDCPLAVDVTSIDARDKLTVTRPVYSGKATYALDITATPCVISVRPNVFTPKENPRSAETRTVQVPATEARARTTEITEPERARLDVGEAPVVVSGGRGLKEAEHFALIESLADALGNAAVGASRAVVDAGWRPHGDQVGQTGKTVSPQLYIAVGISGAIQHLAGMRTSKVIVAINRDKDAPIFKVADYGVVGDLFEIVPRLTEEVRKARGA
jgi:electron transfer flavoprotein alpha subunit